MPEVLALQIVVLLFSVIVHEVMHGFVALKFGDHTAEHAGRLTLNPIPHIDLIGTILLPGLLLLSGSPILFGWAKPVPINPLNFRNLKTGELLVSAAGIFSNLGLAIIAALLYHLLNNFAPQYLLLELLYFAVTINLLLAVFNLIPIPPLDGSKVFLSQLPLNMARKYQQLESYGFILLFALMFIRIGNVSILSLFLGVTVGFLRGLLGF